MQENRAVIIVVDDSPTNLAMVKKTLSDQYDVITISSCTELLKILELVSPDLILLDIEMPDMSGFDVIKRIKETTETENIPVIFLTSRVDPASELQGLSLGAVDFVHKPFSPPLLAKRIELHLLLEAQRREVRDITEDLHSIIDRRTVDIVELHRVMLGVFTDVAQSYEGFTGAHAVLMEDYLLKEADKIISEGDSLRFVKSPAVVFMEHEHEFRIKLQELFGKI